MFGDQQLIWRPERPIFGKVRYMSSENTTRKLRVSSYIEQYRPSKDSGLERQRTRKNVLDDFYGLSVPTTSLRYRGTSSSKWSFKPIFHQLGRQCPMIRGSLTWRSATSI